MDLVDRYVHAVKRHLPAAQQDDIGSELTDDILSKIKDQEEELGRPLDEAEQEAILRPYGHPYLLAMRYRPQQYLIGPAVFPFYWMALKVTLAAALGIHVVVIMATSLARNEPDRILRDFQLFPVAMQAFFWVTIVFAGLEFSQARLRLLDKWSPRTLPRIAERSRRVATAALVAELVGGVLFLIWWLAIPRYPVLILGPAASFITLSPAWHRVYLLAALPSLVSILMLAAILAVPARTWLSKVRPLVVNILTLWTMTMLLKAGDLVTPVATGEREDVVQAINGGITVVLAIVSVVTVVQTVVEVIRLVRAGSPRFPVA